jgi:hypothetical protein
MIINQEHGISWVEKTVLGVKKKAQQQANKAQAIILGRTLRKNLPVARPQPHVLVVA